MGKKIAVVAFAAAVLVAGFVPGNSSARTKGAEKPAQAETCYGCHDTIKTLHTAGKHAKVNCVNCHSGLEKHAADPGPDTRPATDTSWEACGACHKEQFNSFMQQAYHRPARDEKSQLTNRSPNPFWDKLMAGHGFTREHALTRSHVNMLVDHLAVDRAYGGRFQPKKGWQYVLEKGRAWDILEDKYPAGKEHKALSPRARRLQTPCVFSASLRTIS